MRLHVLAISLLLLASASCASAEASQPGSISEADEATVRQLAREGTSPPHGAERPVGVTSEQHLDAIEEAVRRATRQLDSNERIHAVADLRAVWWSEPFQKEDSFGSPPELRRWAAWLVWDEYRRSVGRWGHNLADVERMKVIGEKLPPLLNAADITRPKDWVDAFISPDRRNGGDQIPYRLIKAGGGFDLEGSSGDFPHVYFDKETTLQALRVGPGFDDVVRTLYNEDPLAAYQEFFRISSRFGTPQEVGRFFAVAVAHSKLQREVTRAAWFGPGEKEGLPPVRVAPYTDAIRETLLELAAMPDWPAHLYVFRMMVLHRKWRDPEVVETMLTQGNPITIRYLTDHRDLLGAAAFEGTQLEENNSGVEGG